MMLWLVLGTEALVIVAIFIQMLRKRSSMLSVDEDADLTAETTKPGMSLELPQEEKWE